MVDAKALDLDPWQFAVTAYELLAAGITGTDLLWLIAHKFLCMRPRCLQRPRAALITPFPTSLFSELLLLYLPEKAFRLLSSNSLSFFRRISATRFRLQLYPLDAGKRELSWESS